MDIQQIKLSKMATFCYLIKDSYSRTCALVDPAFETGRVLGIVKKSGYRLTHLINTHCHSDHTAGNADIIKDSGAKLCIHPVDGKRLMGMGNKTLTRLMGGKSSPKPDVLVKDGDEISIGRTKIKIIHTPGHTPGGICLYSKNNLITGDTLFVGAVGRTDLPGGSMKKLVNSIRTKLYSLPGNTIVWPGHDYGLSPTSTIDREIRSNPYT